MGIGLNPEGIAREKLIHAIRESTQDVFSTMLGLEVQGQEAYVDTTAPGPTGGIVSLIGLAGRWVGTGSVNCSADFAREISSHLLMTEFPAVDEEVLDAVAEITNMIIGNVKTAMEEDLGPLGLSIPTVIYGRDFTTRSMGSNEWTVVPFRCGEEQMEVQLCLTPARGGYHVRPASGSPNTMAV
jgi:chemotaxis protein CheX